MKQKYIEPDIEIVKFMAEDIITGSNDLPEFPIGLDDNTNEANIWIE